MVNILNHKSQKGKVLFLEALCSVLFIITIYLCLRNYSLSNRLSRYQPNLNPSVLRIKADKKKKYMGSYKQETLIQSTKDKFSLAPDYSGNLNPRDITFWNAEDFSRRKAKSKNHTAAFTAEGSLEDQIDSIPKDFNFIEDFSNFKSDSLVQILLDRKNIQFASYNFQSHNFITMDYPLDLNRYSYNWNPNSGLTYKRVYPVRILPFVESRYNIFNKELNLGTGIMISTNRFDYSLEGALEKSIGTHNNIKADIEIGVRFKLKPWLR